MSGETKRGWVFDGTRLEFWGAIISSLLLAILIIANIVHFAEGQAPRTNVESGAWMSFAAFAGYLLLWRYLNKVLKLALAISFAEDCARLLILYNKIGQQYAFSVVRPLRIVSLSLFLVALVTFVAKRLRREELDQATKVS